MDNKTEHRRDQIDSTRFRPMSEGLGLNHFADGLPYTPSHSKRKPMVHFNFPPPRSPKASTESAVEAAPESLLLNEVPVMSLEKFEELKVNAGFMRRILAFGTDIAFSTSLFAFIVWASFSLNGYDINALLNERNGVQMFWPLLLLYAVVEMGYFLIQETTWRSTVGKALFGIRIEATSGFATLGRSVCFLISVAPMGIGLLWYFFDSKRRCWHDVVTDSEVVKA